MFKSRLIRVFSTFDAAEKAGLRKFVFSPYHNSRKDVVQLLDFLISNPNTAVTANKSVVYKILFPKDHSYDDFKMRQTMTFLLRLIEKYLIAEHFKEQKVEQQIILSKIYRARNLNSLIPKSIKKAGKILHQNSIRNVDYFNLEYHIQVEHHAYSAREKRVAPLNLQKMNDTLDIRYIGEKLRRTCLTLAHGNVFNYQYEIELLKEIEILIKQKKLLQIPLIATYYYTYKSLIEDDPLFFRQLKNTLFQHLDIFSKDELRDLFILSINYCIKKINNGDNEFIQESFDLYQTGLTRGVFLQNGFLSRFTYKNIVAAGLKLGEFDTIESFISDYKNQLESQYRESNYSYNLARLYYTRKEYHAAMQLLLQVEYDDIFLNLDSKNMLMKMYFELKEYDALESLLESMRTYLLRKKVIGYHKTNYKNIIRFTRKLLKLNPYSESQKNKLKLEIQESQPLTERKWLLDQL